MAGVTLTRAGFDPYDTSIIPGFWVLKVTAVSTEPDLDSRIFVYHAHDSSVAQAGDVFENIASILDMQEIPPDAPFPGDDTQFPIPKYRKNVCIFYFGTPEELEDVWRIIQEDTDLLVRSIRAAEELVNIETVLINPDTE